MSRHSSLVRVGVAYVAALGVGAIWLYLGPGSPWLWLDALVADVLATLVIFGFSRFYANSSFYDAYWSLVPPLLMLWWWSEAGTSVGADPARFWLMAAVMLLWAARLTGNWLYSFPGLHHEDWRYPQLRERAGRLEWLVDLFAIHLVPTLQVFAALLPVYVVATRPSEGLGWLDAMALVVALGAVTLETVADLQMHRFARTRSPGQVMDRGLWSWSRHPNYFGELGFWVGMALFGLAAAPGAWWWLFLGALGIGAILLGASIPMMEERSLQRRPGYQDVIDRVSRFVPRPPRRVDTPTGAPPA